jgi:hypothetical protein
LCFIFSCFHIWGWTVRTFFFHGWTSCTQQGQGAWTCHARQNFLVSDEFWQLSRKFTLDKLPSAHTRLKVFQNKGEPLSIFLEFNKFQPVIWEFSCEEDILFQRYLRRKEDYWSLILVWICTSGKVLTCSRLKEGLLHFKVIWPFSHLSTAQSKFRLMNTFHYGNKWFRYSWVSWSSPVLGIWRIFSGPH